MGRRRQEPVRQETRRTTLTLPADSLLHAERSEKIISSYKKAFSGFSEDELAILDGVILGPASEN